MKYITEFRNGNHAKTLAAKIADAVDPTRNYKFMEFCGGHTHAIHRYGIPKLLPKNVEMIHGPGCPVCILPIARIDQAIALAQIPDVIFCSYGDMLRVPATDKMSLLKAKAMGADVRMVYSIDDALKIAEANPVKRVIFFAIGFETTTPPTALALQYAKRHQLTNFFVFCNHVLTPPALMGLMDQHINETGQAIALDGFVGPAHVSIVIGYHAYNFVAEKYQKPIVISGFEPLDLLHSIYMLILQVNAEEARVANQYTRAVAEQGNQIALAAIADTMELRIEFEWRGLGIIPNSALCIKPKYREFDAEHNFELITSHGQEHKACECGAILRGVKKPKDCKLFATVCTPENPLGSCMVSSEGACAAVYAYGRLHEEKEVSS